MRYYISEIDPAGEIAVDDTILVQGVQSTAGSKILGGFVPLFDAEAVTKIKEAGFKLAGKTNVGEFGLDLVGEFSFYGAAEEGSPLKNAAACLVNEKKVKAVLSVDLNGAPRRAAALSGQTFIKPTYGTVSRYGVISCAGSGEQIGVLSDTAKNAKEILSVIAGHDDKDGTSLPKEKYDYCGGKEVSALRVCVVNELLEAAGAEVEKEARELAAQLAEGGAAVEFRSVPEFRLAQTAWQILLAAETCNNISRYDGVKFGYRTPEYEDIDDLYVKSRSEGMNLLTKETLIYGSDVLSKGRYDACYDKALRIRRVVFDKLKALFGDYDLLLTPVCSKVSYEPYEIREAFRKVYEESLFTAAPSITGMPAIVTHGVQLIADDFNENLLFAAADFLDQKEVL